MIVRVEGKWLLFVSCSDQEWAWIGKHFIWTDYDGNKQTILFDLNNQPKTYWGIYKFLKKHAPFPVEVENQPQVPKIRVKVPDNLLDGITLIDFQVAAVQKALMFKTGIIESITGSGKSYMILAICRWLMAYANKQRGLVVVPSMPLADQLWTEAMNCGFSEQEVGRIHGKKKNFDSQIRISVINSLIDRVELIKEADFICVDEVHSIRAEMYHPLVMSSNTDYILGFSGSPYSSFDMSQSYGDMTVLGLSGGVVYRTDTAYIRKIGLVAEPVILFKTVPGLKKKYRGNPSKIYNENIVDNYYRNNIIVEYSEMFHKLGFKTLILVQHQRHAKILMEKLKHLRVISVFGANKGLKLDDLGNIQDCSINYQDVRQEFADECYDILIASPVLDTGFDLSGVGGVIMGAGNKPKIKYIQRVGRGLRRKKIGPNRVYILDFIDRGHVYSYSHSMKRRRIYEEIQAVITEDHYAFNRMLYDHARQVAEAMKLQGAHNVLGSTT